MKYLLTFEAKRMRKFKYEESIIDPIVDLMGDQDMVENLPCLAKLGYMYEILYYAGRVCWGSTGLIQKGNECESNPRDKIEDLSEEAYSAWSMHIEDTMDGTPPTYQQFCNLIRNGKPMTEYDERLRKPNKTFNEWVDVLTDKRNKYHSIYPNRRSVMNHLLTTIGNGYSINSEGYIIATAGGADEDESQYGMWENSKFPPEVESIIEGLLSIPELKETIETYHSWKAKLVKEKNDKERKSWAFLYKCAGLDINDESITMDDVHKKLDSMKYPKDREEKYHQWYISESSSIIGQILDEERPQKCEPETLQACIEICEEILAHESEEKKYNINFARRFLAIKAGRTEYEKFLPKKYDKYALLDEVKTLFHDITDELTEAEKSNINSMGGHNAWTIYLNDSKKSRGADNCYYCVFNLMDSSLPKGRSCNVEFLEGASIYNDLKTAIDRLTDIELVKLILFHYDNVDEKGASIQMKISVNSKSEDYHGGYDRDIITTENMFEEQGFQVGHSMMDLELPKIGVILEAKKSRPLGSSHPDNNEGKEYFSEARSLNVVDTSYRDEIKFTIDERGFNTLSNDKKPRPSMIGIYHWIIAEHKAMKASDPQYGTFDGKDRKGTREGSKKLYVHDFMLWLRDHQDNYLAKKAKIEKHVKDNG